MSDPERSKSIEPTEESGATPDPSTAKKKPPRGRRFKKGESGNPFGRPSGARDRAKILATVASEEHVVGEGRKKRRLTTLELMLLRLRQHALGGKVRAVRLYHHYLQRYGSQEPLGEGGYIVLLDQVTDSEAYRRRVYENQRKYREA